jgi:hypothetical protein
VAVTKLPEVLHSASDIEPAPVAFAITLQSAVVWAKAPPVLLVDVASALPPVHRAVAPFRVFLAVAVAVHPEAFASALPLEPVALAVPPESLSASDPLPLDAVTTAELVLSAVAFAPLWLVAVAVAVLP